jgi:outer membrane cobalamin receptor
MMHDLHSGGRRRPVWALLQGALVAAVLAFPARVLGLDDGAAMPPGAASDTTLAAQPAEDSLRVYALREILVTATRLPPGQAAAGNVAVATSADLAELASTTAAEGLAADPGIGLARYGSYGSLQTLSIRGGSSSEVIYLLDGVPLGDSQISVVDLNWLPGGGTDRVEAMKGGASPIYGSGAISGAINVVSMDALVDVPSSQVTGWTGGHGSRAADVLLRRSFAGRLGVLASYDYLKSDGWIASSGCRRDKYYGKLAARTGSGSRLNAVGFRYDGDVEVPGAFPGRQEDLRTFYSLSASSAGDQGFAASYYHSASDETFTSIGDIYGTGVYRHEGWLDGFQFSAYRRTGESKATSFGAGLERKHIRSNSAGEREASDVYGFVQREVREDRVELGGSLRLEKNSQFAFEASPQVTCQVKAGRGLAFLRLDRSFMYPSFNDLYWRGPDEQGDPGLKTEHSTGAELGARLVCGPVAAGAAAYYRHVNDLIIWRTDSACSSTRSTNAQARMRGVELSLEIAPAPGLEASISYSLARATDGAGEILPYRAPRVLTWTARATRTLSKHVSAGLVFSGRNVARVNSGSQLDYGTMACLAGTSLPTYTSGLLYAYVAIDRARVFARATNLFDAGIYPSWGMPRLPGRSYEAGVSWELID